jgi:hypothetical protein
MVRLLQPQMRQLLHRHRLVDYTVTREITQAGTDLRCRRLTLLLAGYAISDYIGLAVRLAQKISMTYALACEMYRLVDKVVWDGAGRLAMRACRGRYHRLSLRPTLVPSGAAPDSALGPLMVGGERLRVHRWVESHSPPETGHHASPRDGASYLLTSIDIPSACGFNVSVVTEDISVTSSGVSR